MVVAASSIVREMIKRFMSMILSLSKITIKIETFKFEMFYPLSKQILKQICPN